MPIESVPFVTYYNIFEYLFPICLLTVCATLVYIGVSLFKTKTPLVLPTAFTTFLFALFLFPTFLHSINHLTDTIGNTVDNNALNIFGAIGIPVVLGICWFGMPGIMVFGRSAKDSRRALKTILQRHESSFEERGFCRVRSSLGTFVIWPVLFWPIVVIYIWPPKKRRPTKEFFADLEVALQDRAADTKGNSVKVSAIVVFATGLVLGILCFVSWTTSTLVIRPFSVMNYLHSLF